MFRVSIAIGLIAVIVPAILTIVLQKHHHPHQQKKVEYNDAGCKLLPNIGPCSEDIVVVNNKLALVSAGDIDRIFLRNWKKPVKEGSIFAVRFDNDGMVRSEKILLENFPHRETFHPHGISYSNHTKRLYAVSHDCGERTFEGIEIFQLVMEDDDDDDDDDDSVKLVHEATLQSSTLFPLGSLNNIVEGAYLGELYVTQWIPSAIPEKCVGSGRLLDELKLPLSMLFRRMTKVHRCTWRNPENNNMEDQGFACTVVAEGFKSANGITSDPETKHIYVVDPLDDALHVFDRNDNGTLNRTAIIRLPHTGDNVKFDVASQKLTLSASPIFHQVFRRTVGDRSVQVSGGMLTIDPHNNYYNDENNNYNYKIEDILMHDGSKLSMISAAVFVNGNIVLGSPASDGVLVCPIPEKK